MSSRDRTEKKDDDGVVEGVTAPSVALVPVVISTDWVRPASQPRSNSVFVTQLIATAEPVPQTRGIRRAAAADAQNAYGAQPASRAGMKTRQII